MRILLLNCYSRNSLAIIEALDPDVEIYGATITRDNFVFMKPDKIFKHRRIKKIFRHSDPLKSLKDFEGDIIAICQAISSHGVIASGTTITNALSECKKSIERESNCTVMVEDFEKLDRVTDKWTTYELAQKLAIKAPYTVLLDGSVAMDKVLATFPFPAVVKPRKSFASIGVQFFQSLSELKSWIVKNPNLLDGSHLIQERIEGDLHDVTACGQNGKAVSILSQRRLQSLYDFGGGGIVNITTDCPVPRESVKKIMSEMCWNGPIEFDFMMTSGGEFYLIECNPKIWGTTYLTVLAGMNVVQQAIDIFVEKKETEVIEFYEIGLLYRWVFPECVFNWIQSPRTLRNVTRRVRETFARNGANRSLNNFKMRFFPHLLGIIFDKAQL